MYCFFFLLQRATFEAILAFLQGFFLQLQEERVEEVRMADGRVLRRGTRRSIVLGWGRARVRDPGEGGQ